MRGSRVTLVLSLIAGLAFTTPAGAAGSGSINGKVTDEAGLPLEGICVAAGARYVWPRGHATTAADGTYSISGLTNASYAVLFTDCRPEPRYLTEWFDDQLDYYGSDYVTISTTTPTANDIDAALTLGGFVTGTVLDDGGDAARTCIAAHVDRSGWLDVVATAYTDEDGSYRLGPLPPAGVQVLFGDCEVRVPIERYTYPFGVVIGIVVPQGAPQGYVREWYDDHLGYGGDSVPVIPGTDTPGIDAIIAVAGGITGTVTDESGGPLKEMCIIAFGDVTTEFGETDENGFYAIDRLAPGEYKILFYDCYGSVYRSEWFDDQPSSILADSVAVARKVWKNEISAALGKRPRPDLAVVKLSVSSVPLEVSDVTLAGSPWLRTIDVDISNLGSAMPDEQATLMIWAQSITDGRSQVIVSNAARVMPGATEHRSYEWNALGTIGDVNIYASVCSFDDADRSNDLARSHAYAVAGGLGVGVRADLPDSPSSPYYCEPGVFRAAAG